MKTRVIRTIAAALTLSFVLGVVGCSSKDDSDEEPSSSQEAAVATTVEDIAPSIDDDNMTAPTIEEQAEPTSTPSPTPTTTPREIIEAKVAGYFYELLNRYPTSEELDAWATEIENSVRPDYSALIDAIVNSDEFNRADEKEYASKAKIGFYVAEIYEGLIGSEIPDDVLATEVDELYDGKPMSECIADFISDSNYNLDGRESIDVVFDIIRVVCPSECDRWPQNEYVKYLEEGITLNDKFKDSVGEAIDYLDNKAVLAAVERIVVCDIFDGDIEARCDALGINVSNQ